MLLAQKSYVEGGLALTLYCARLVDEQHSATSDAERAETTLLLEILTPIAKIVAVAVVPRGERPRDPGARRLRLHARLPGGAALPRQSPEPDPRRHARHPGARPAGSQGEHGGRQGPRAARCAHGDDHCACPRDGRCRPRCLRRRARRGTAARRPDDEDAVCGPRSRAHPCQRHRVPRGLRARRARLGLARAGARRARQGRRLLRRQAPARAATSSAGSCRGRARSSRSSRASTTRH